MKRAWTAAFCWLAGIAWAAAPEPDCRLLLESPMAQVHAGDPLELRLHIVGPAVGDIVRHTDGFTSGQRSPSFVYRFEVIPRRPGVHFYGPYHIVFNGRKLVSNRLAVEVLPPRKNQRDSGDDAIRLGTFFRVDRTVITLGESVELVAETWAERFPRGRIRFARSDEFSVSPGDMAMQTRQTATGTFVYKRQSWRLTPHRVGPFHITRSLFREFPDEIPPPNITIEVKEPPLSPSAE